MATPPCNSDAFGVNTNHHPHLHPAIYSQLTATTGKGKKDNDDDDDRSYPYLSGGGQKEHRTIAPWSSLRSSAEQNVSLLSGLSFAKLCFRSVAFATITLYVLNQKHMLPKPLGRVVSRALFWPTLPITASRRIGKWTTVIDNAVVLGGAPFGFLNYPDKLHSQFRVRGVVNMCEEYEGPVKSYRRLGIEHLRLPTVDHFEPSVEDLKKAVSFIQKHESRGGRVYVHCRAGHGRSAAAVYAWLLYKEPLADPVELNEKMCAMRNVRKSLHSQPNVNAFRRWLQSGGVSDSEDEEEFTWPRTDNNRKPWNESARNRPRNDYANGKEKRRFNGGGSESGEDDVYPASSLGRVFSSEEEDDWDWTSEESSQNNDEYYDYSEDEF